MVDFSKKYTPVVKNTAVKLGFDFCGISKAVFLEEEAPKLENWLKNQHHGKMSYLERHFDKRLDPSLLVPGAKSVISLIYNYYPEEPLPENHNYKLAKYAYGQDYHYVVKSKLKELVSALEDAIGNFACRVFVDSAPVMERQWAAKSGLGWIGKNSLLLNQKMGSFFFLAELICDLDLNPDDSIGDYCGTCTHCIDACPTDAILEPQVVDANRCISYLTIELKDEIPSEFKGKTEDWIFGCDICQDVCPWNRFAKPHKERLFSPNEELKNFKKHDWEEMTHDIFCKVFKKSAVKRAKFQGIKRNALFNKENKDHKKKIESG